MTANFVDSINSCFQSNNIGQVCAQRLLGSLIMNLLSNNHNSKWRIQDGGRKNEKAQYYLELWKCNNRFIISDPKNPRVNTFANVIVLFFSFLRLPSWFRHFELWKSDNGFIISDPKNPCVRIFTHRIVSFFIFATAISKFPVLIMKIW